MYHVNQLQTWNKTFDILESHGILVKLANPLKTRAIAEARIKTDKVDAQVLAHLLRADLVATCYVADGDTRAQKHAILPRTIAMLITICD